MWFPMMMAKPLLVGKQIKLNHLHGSWAEYAYGILNMIISDQGNV
jgi:hypothetical protein